MKNRLTDLLGIHYPIIQAPIGSATTPALAAAVSNAGGLGTLALSWKDLSTTREYIRRTKSLTTKPFAVNLVLAFPQEDRVRICIEEKVPVVSFFWGDSTPFIERLKKENILVCQTIGDSEEAKKYEKNGVDFLIAQGWEAGGHVWGKVATSVLVPAVVDQVAIPVVASGGVADGRGILAALCLGASGVWMGTRFLMTKEADCHRIYQDLILYAKENDAVYADRLFNKGWDFAPHRVLRNSTVRGWEKSGQPELGARPFEDQVIAVDNNGIWIERYSDTIPLRTTVGSIEAMALYCGQTAGIISDIKSAGQLITDLVNEVQSLQREIRVHAF